MGHFIAKALIVWLLTISGVFLTAQIWVWGEGQAEAERIQACGAELVRVGSYSRLEAATVLCVARTGR